MLRKPNRDQLKSLKKLIYDDDFSNFMCYLKLNYELITQQALMDINLPQDQINLYRGVGVALQEILKDVEIATKPSD